jgi:glycosyltransferase involved in cell wall biosynthesis
MSRRLEVDPAKITVIHNGLDVTAFAPAKPDPNWPVIGYFARMIHGKGLTTLVDAFIDLATRGTLPRLKLKIGGAKTPADEKYLSGLRSKLKDHGLAERVEWHPNLSFNDKVKFFRDLTVFSVPATYGEAFGLYVIEAIASGVPVVQPQHGAFPELIEATGGGILCQPENPKALADALEALLLDGQQREKIISTSMTRVRSEFTAMRMAAKFEEALLSLRQ